MGLKKNPENRWIKMAELILWDEFEIKYAELSKRKQKCCKERFEWH